ncbi:MAG: XRE family transcriptional regulator [Chloroflexota bacterium]
MIGRRLRQYRMSRNLSLDALAAKMGGIVTKQALSKYELDKAQPSPVVLSKLAATLGVKAADLLCEPTLTVEFVAYRKASGLLQRDQTRVESIVEQALEERVRLQELVGQTDGSAIPIRKLPVRDIEETEAAADRLRDMWQLGRNPIADFTYTLEDHFITVLEVEASERFDGIAAVAYDEERKAKAAAIVTRSGVPGERQRLNLAHELGHLVLDVSEGLDEEKAAFRFGGALLAPAAKLLQAVGPKRALIQSEELVLLKKQFGLSIQALLYRLRDLNIITESYYKRWCVEVNRRSWRRHEPLQLPSEKPHWLERNVLRLLGEGLISQQDAKRMLGDSVPLEEPLSVIERRAFMRLPLEKRRRILAEQAKRMARHYEQDVERKEIQGGDVIEY